MHPPTHPRVRDGDNLFVVVLSLKSAVGLIALLLYLAAIDFTGKKREEIPCQKTATTAQPFFYLPFIAALLLVFVRLSLSLPFSHAQRDRAQKAGL